MEDTESYPQTFCDPIYTSPTEHDLLLGKTFYLFPPRKKGKPFFHNGVNKSMNNLTL